MTDSAEYDKINEAIVRFLHSSWSKETEGEIEQAYGVDVAVKVRTVYDEAIHCPVDWRTATMDSALDTLAEFLPARFPWLTPDAKTRLNYAYIMVWK